jgi:hypothetical protein
MLNCSANPALKKSYIKSLGSTALSAAVLLASHSAMAQSVAAGAIPTGRFASVAESTIGFICITIGVIMVVFGILYGIFQFMFRQEGAGTIVKCMIVGGLVGSVMAIAVWVVGTTPTLATLPLPTGF